MRPEFAAFLGDVRNAADRIGTFIAGLTKDECLVDELRRSAVERQLEIIGEALNNLRRADGDTAALIPEVGRIIGLRNVLTPGYAVVDDSVVWAAASHRVPSSERLSTGCWRHRSLGAMDPGAWGRAARGYGSVSQRG